MAQQTLTDAHGKIVGFIKDSGEKKIVTDAHGKIKGTYDPKQNKTFDAYGALIGTGNQLSSLLR